eukprot:m.37449 g.37449  ORF g.37449 m.37449 type:complete len:464 (+) comp11106_c0_seq1:159-1550(+)
MKMDGRRLRLKCLDRLNGLPTQRLDILEADFTQRAFCRRCLNKILHLLENAFQIFSGLSPNLNHGRGAGLVDGRDFHADNFKLHSSIHNQVHDAVDDSLVKEMAFDFHGQSGLAFGRKHALADRLDCVVGNSSFVLLDGSLRGHNGSLKLGRFGLAGMLCTFLKFVTAELHARLPEAHQHAVNLVHGERPFVGEIFDHRRHCLDLRVGDLQVELLGSVRDGVPAGQAVGKLDVAINAKICWVNDLVRTRVGHHSLGVHASLVGKGRRAGNVVVKGNFNVGCGRDVPFQVPQQLEVKPAGDGFLVNGVHASQQSTKGRDAVALANTKHTCVDVCRTSLQGNQCIGNAAASVVVNMKFNASVRRHYTAHRRNDTHDLQWGRNADSVCDADAINTKCVNSLVNAQNFRHVAAKRVLAAEADLQPMVLDVANDLTGSLDHGLNALAVGVLSENLAGRHVQVDTVYTR